MLTPGFVKHYGRRVRQIQAPVIRPHRNFQNLCRGQAVEYIIRQATCFGSEQDRIAGSVFIIGMRGQPARRDRGHAWMTERVKAVLQRIVFAQLSVFVVIETRAAQLPVIEFETEWFNKMQGRPGIRAKAYDISRVGRNFRLEQDQMKH